MLNLEGRTAVVFGLANKRSIAWAIAQKLHAAGVNLAISYQNERLRSEAEDLAAELPGAKLFQTEVLHRQRQRTKPQDHLVRAKNAPPQC